MPKIPQNYALEECKKNIDFAEEELRNSPKKCLEFSKKALEFEEITNFPKLHFNALHKTSIALARLTELEESLKYNLASISVASENKMKLELGKAIFQKGVINSVSAKYHTALENHFKAYKIFKRLNYSQGISKCLHAIGKCYYDLGNFDGTMKANFKALELNEKLGDKFLIASSLNNIGISYFQADNFERALDFFQRTRKMARDISDIFLESFASNNIGVIFRHQEKFQESIDCFETALKLKIQLNDQRGISHTLINLGEIYSQLGNLAKARNYFENVIQVTRETNTKYELVRAIRDLTEINEKEGNLTQAINGLKEAMEIAVEIDVKPELIEIYKSLSNLFYKTKDYEKAFIFQKKFADLREIIFTNDKEKSIAGMQAKFETELYRLKNIELVNMNEKLVSTQNKLVDAERKSMYLATVVTANHEISQPLTVLLGNVGLLQSEIESNLNPQRLEKIAFSMRKSIDRISDVLQSLNELEDPNFTNYIDEVKMVKIRE
ncbi:MAG: hypothetical protein DWQ06_11100 [Calditrichaeota bacterium]|nr:MAG: hypothetical protein DWQ06_11100 [Calditrichota bacterium]